MNGYTIFKCCYLISATLIAMLTGMSYMPKYNLSDDAIRESHALYCQTENRLKSAQKLYDKCIESTPSTTYVTNQFTVMRVCRGNAYDLSGISGYTSNNVELTGSFTRKHTKNAENATATMSDGTRLNLNCEIEQNGSIN